MIPRPLTTCALSVGGALAGLIIGATITTHWQEWLTHAEQWHRSRLVKECAARGAVTTRRAA